MSSEAGVRISVLGKPALFVEDHLRPFGGPRKAIALLAYLLLHRDRPLLRSAIAEQFWPDDEDEGARSALRRHLHRALAVLPRPAAGRPWVLADRTTVRWNPLAPLELDTSEYERLAKSGDLAAAVDLYRGDYVEDFYEDWILVERERLRNGHAANLVTLIERCRRDLDYPTAIGYAQALLRMDNLREDALRRLMALRYAAGDRSGALADFESFDRRLGEELAAEPMPETLALRDAIRRDEMRTVDAGGAPPENVVAGFPFVGREDALRSVRRMWESAARGRGTTVLISGEAGIGKSRLIGELIALSEAQGGRIAVGTTSTTETEPYQPIAEALRGALPLLRFEAIEPVKLAALATLLREVGEFAPNLPPAPPLDNERDRHRLFDAISTAFGHVAAKRPLLAVFEDIHWASGGTIALLDVLVRRLRGAPVLIVLSAREENLDANEAARAFLRRLEPEHSLHVGLGPLSVEDVRKLSKVAADVPDVLALDFNCRTGGNPLFLTEVLREHLRGVGSEGIPANVGAMVAGRVARLSEPARALVETAAVAGAGFDSDVVRHVLGWTFAQVFDALDELLDQALVRESPRRRGDFTFSHQLVHAAVYEGLPSAARLRLHRRMGRTLHRLFGDRPALYGTIARHYDSAGLDAEALQHLTLAIQHALAVFSNEEAIALATRALEIAADQRVRFDLHRSREEAAARVGDTALQEADDGAMQGLATALGDSELLGFALCRSIARCMHLGKRDEERAGAAALRDLSEKTSSPAWSLEAALAEARLACNVGDLDGAEAILAAAAPLVSVVADDRLAFDYWIVRSFVVTHDSLELGRAYLEHARVRVGESRALHIRYLRAGAHLADREGDASQLQRLASDLLEHYIEMGDIEGQALAHQNLAIAQWYTLDLASQREHLRLALEAYNRLGKTTGVAAVLINRGVAAQHVGDFGAAEADYCEAQRIAETVGQSVLAELAKADLASLATFRNAFTAARALALDALPSTHADELQDVTSTSAALTALGVAERELGEYGPACVHLEAARRTCGTRDPRGALDILIELIPVYVALGKTTAALECARELLRDLDPDRRRVVFPAYALSAIASAFAASGDTERADALHCEAAALLEDLAARIPDETSREGYRGLPFHRSILARSASRRSVRA